MFVVYQNYYYCAEGLVVQSKYEHALRRKKQNVNIYTLIEQMFSYRYS
jgi:hypothetical protein